MEQLGETIINLRDVLGLQVGDVVKLGKKVDEELVAKVDKRPKFKCHPGVVGNRIAVEITKVIEKG